MVDYIQKYILKKVFPFKEWISDLKNPKTLQADLIAGLTVALVLVPQSMAYAQLAGLPPYYGLYASFLPVAIASLFGSSRQLATGPVAVVSLLTAAALEPIASNDPSGYVAYAIMLAFLVGIFQLSLGLLRMGVLVDFLSQPVVRGFTNAAAIIIGTSQLSKLFGVTVESGEQHYQTVLSVISESLLNTHNPTLLMGILAIFLIIFVRKVSVKLPAVLISVAITTFIFSVDYIFSNILAQHQQKRINILVGKEIDPHGAGYNLIQSKIAIGSGGILGKGFLKGTQTRFDFVPEQSTDFIFCTIGEEWGFLGSLVFILLYIGLLLRLAFLAERQRSNFSRIYGYSVVTILFLHFVINIGMTIGLLPIIGIPLPFISYGGSSLLGFTVLLFIFLNLDSYRLQILR